MMNYKVFIPCAGLGSRLGNLTRDKNKALIDINGKKIISYIVEKFDSSMNFVIALGYQGDQVKSFLLSNYPNHFFEFVYVDDFDSPRSGLGYSISLCEKHLQCPFVFISNDTIVEEMIPSPSFNWMGYANVQDLSEFRSVELSVDSMVVAINEKGATGHFYPYIGLCGIFDYAEFWSCLKLHPNFISVGESAGLSGLMSIKQIKGLYFSWWDTGNPISLKMTKHHLEGDKHEL